MNRVSRLAVVAPLAAFAIALAYTATRTNSIAEVSNRAPGPPKGDPAALRFAPGAAQLASIKVSPVEEFPVPLAEPLNGRIAYDENATARVSSPILGRVVSLRALPGDFVKAGESLLVMDSPDLAQAVSDLAKARADELRKTQANERAKALLDGGVIPLKDQEGTEADLAQARAETQRAELRLRNLNLKSGPAGDGRFHLRAPLSGVIAERQVNPGMEVRPDLQNPLFVITDPTRLWVIIDLPERNLSKVEIGHPVSVEVDAYPNEPFRATIQRVGETVDPVTRRVQVRCSISSPDRKLKPEMYARVRLLSDEHKRAVRVPNSALITEGLYTYVFVEKDPGVFEKRRVMLYIQDQDFSYIATGLERGERVVMVGPLLLNAELKLAQ